jgi:glycogen debranching enzyme
LRQLFHGMQRHLREAGVGQVSEIADGNAPHTPRGCFAQAWSVAELLRAAAESVWDSAYRLPELPAVSPKKKEVRSDLSVGASSAFYAAGR